MNTFARGAGVLVVVVVAVGALALMIGPKSGIGGPGSSPSESPATTAPASQPPLPTLGATFVSPSYGYQLGYPTGWTVTPAGGQWIRTTNFGPGDPVADSIVTPPGASRMRITAASVALPSGTTMEQFRRFASPYSSPFQSDPCTPVAPISGPVTIQVQDPGKAAQQVAAVVSINGCDALAELGGHVYDVDVIAGGRGYDFVLDGALGPADALAWLGSVKLEPANATGGIGAPSPAASK